MVSFTSNSYRADMGTFASNWGGLNNIVLGAQVIDSSGGTGVPWISVGV